MNNLRFVTRVTCLFVCCAVAASLPISAGAETVPVKETAPVKEAERVTAADKSVAASVENMIKAGHFRLCREFLNREKTRLSAADYNYWIAKSWFREAQAVDNAQLELNMKETGASFSSTIVLPMVEDMPVMLRHAMTSIDIAIGATPNRADLYQLRSEIYSQFRMNVPAIIDASKAIALESKNPGRYVWRAAAWYAANSVKPVANQILADPEIKAKLFEISHLPEEKQQNAIMNEALSDINAAIRLNPKDGCCYSFRSKVFRSLGDRWNDVFEDQTHAIELDPENAGYYHDRAYTWQWVSPPDLKKALSDATKAVELEPGRASHRELRAMFLLQLKQWDALEAEYLVLDKLCDGGWYKQKKAEAKHAMGKTEEASKIWESCNDSSSVTKAAYISMSLGDLDRAIKLCDRAFELEHGPQIQAHWLKARALQVKGEKSQALKEGEVALAMAKTAHLSDLDQAARVVPAVTKTEIEEFCNSIKRETTGN